jgi:hypothetical protein
MYSTGEMELKVGTDSVISVSEKARRMERAGSDTT